MTPLIGSEVGATPCVSDDVGVNSDVVVTPPINACVGNFAGVNPNDSRDADVNPCVSRDVDVTLCVSGDVDVPPCSSGEMNVTPCVRGEVNVTHSVNEDVDVTPCVSSNSRLDPNAQCFVPRKLPMHDAEGVLKVHRLVKQSGLPNFRGCRIPVPTKLNISRWRELALGYPEPRDLELLEYGFPSSFQGDVHDRVGVKNHRGARDFPQAVGKYVKKEVELGATLGPFQSNPLGTPLAIPP